MDAVTLLLVERGNKIMLLTYGSGAFYGEADWGTNRGERLLSAQAYEREGTDLQSIFIGKVKNVLPSLEAAFVEYQSGKTGFLPGKKVGNPLLLNRSYDGRLIAGDELAVQVDREGMQSKVPGLTCLLSLQGQYAALTRKNPSLGFSAKLPSSKKEELKKGLAGQNMDKRLREEGWGAIVRTNAGELEDAAPLIREIEELLKKGRKLWREAPHRTCFSALYRPMKPYLVGIQNTCSAHIRKILTDREELYREVQTAFGDRFSEASAQPKIVLYQDESISLSRLYRVETCLEEALGGRVWLKSGAYLVIQPTEALTVIDVNSGKLQKKRPDDDFFRRVNLEAAMEIALQIRLRNLSGIILVDFINQDNADQDRQLLQFLSKLVKSDPVKTDVIDITPLGLVEITRKKISSPLREQCG